MQGKTHLSSISIYAGEILQSLDKARRAVESVTICIVSRLSAQRYRFKGSLSTLLRCGTACDDGRSSVVVCSDWSGLFQYGLLFQGSIHVCQKWQGRSRIIDSKLAVIDRLHVHVCFWQGRFLALPSMEWIKTYTYADPSYRNAARLPITGFQSAYQRKTVGPGYSMSSHSSRKWTRLVDALHAEKKEGAPEAKAMSSLRWRGLVLPRPSSGVRNTVEWYPWRKRVVLWGFACPSISHPPLWLSVPFVRYVPCPSACLPDLQLGL